MPTAPRPQPLAAIHTRARGMQAGRAARAEGARRGLVLPVATAVLLLLTACDGPLVMHQRSGTEATPAALGHAWSTPATQPDWIPEDSTRLRFVAKTMGPADATPAVVRVATGEQLPASCVVSALKGRPALVPGWAPTRLPSKVSVCGNWAVVRVSDGWFGWTPVA